MSKPSSSRLTGSAVKLLDEMGGRVRELRALAGMLGWCLEMPARGLVRAAVVGWAGKRMEQELRGLQEALERLEKGSRQ